MRQSNNDQDEGGSDKKMWVPFVIFVHSTFAKQDVKKLILILTKTWNLTQSTQRKLFIDDITQKLSELLYLEQSVLMES